ncbi:MAG: GtrA family protein [Acidobacteria bacterium]|nr:GtrA family protein [Acidobacteriota bacterium]
MIERWLRFNAVGLLGAGVQLAALATLKSGLGVSAMMATALAVEIAVLHNFLWHERWTWRTQGLPGLWPRLAKFHLANGFVSILSNLAWMYVLAQLLGMNYLLANGVAIAATSLVNFALGERFVFRR